MLLALGVTTRSLLVCFGFNKVATGKPPYLLRATFHLEPTIEPLTAYTAAGAEALGAGLCVIGLWRCVVLPLPALINSATLMHVWWAVLAPFRWWIDRVNRIAFNSRVFHPSSITLTGCLVLIAFRWQDLDTLLRPWRLTASRATSPSPDAPRPPSGRYRPEARV